MDSALGYWRRRMLTAYEMGIAFYGRPVIEPQFPQLTHFQQTSHAHGEACR
jgi:hypothetical protein